MGHWAMPPPKFEIVLIFFFFLVWAPWPPSGEIVEIVLILSRSATCEAIRIPSLQYQISRFVLLVVNRICIKTM